MTKVAATEEIAFRVASPLGDVYAFFADPTRVREETTDVASFELLAPGKARWTFASKSENGLKFLPEYVAVYEGNGVDRVSWRSLSGTMDVDGTVELLPAGEGLTEIRYRETIAPDLPITPILARIFGPIVKREIKKDVGAFLSRVKRRFGEA